MGTPTPAPESTSEYYLWQIPDKPVAVRLNLDVIDSLLPEVMRAYAAVPKRGAESGGILIGSIERTPEDRTLVRVDRAEIVPCLYARGPSYLLTGEDKQAFEETCAKWSADPSRSQCAVGYFRSHTRDGLTLSPDDLELIDRHFSDATNIALLIRPFASKPVQAGFLFREDGSFQQAPPLTFVFSRKELGADSPPPIRAAEPVAQVEAVKPVDAGPEAVAPVQADSAVLPEEPRGIPPVPSTGEQPEPRRARLPGWLLVPVALICLLVGVAAGVLIPRYVAMPSALSSPPDFSLGLSVAPSGDAISVHWNPDAPAIRAAQSGTLEIEDGGYVKPVDLDTSHLLGGSVIYRNSSPTVRFRLVLSEAGRVTIAETAEWAR